MGFRLRRPEKQVKSDVLGGILCALGGFLYALGGSGSILRALGGSKSAFTSLVEGEVIRSPEQKH